jgi:hypothetical protein
MTGMDNSDDSHAMKPLSELPDAESELVRLVSAAFDGSATQADAAKLEQLLQSPSALASYNALIDVEAALRWKMSLQRRRKRTNVVAAATLTPQRGVGRWLQLSVATGQSFLRARAAKAIKVLRGTLPPADRLREGSLALTLTLVIVVTSGLGFWWIVGGGSSASGLADGVATITALERVKWVKPYGGFQRGDHIRHDTELVVAAGLVQVHHLGGARVVIDGPASYRVTNGMTGYLGRGRLAATLEGRTGTFAVYTPSAVVIDQGTQFGVAVDADGATDVRVLEGAVELTVAESTQKNKPLRLAAGEAAGVDRAGQVSSVAPVDLGGFVTLVPTLAALERPPENLPFGWDETAAITIYHDAFDGSGPLAGTTAASRGGVGDAVWVTPSNGWQCNPLAKGLDAQGAGTACLPFRPEAGFVYRLTVAFDVVSGGNGWAAIGFVTRPRPDDWNLDYAWMLQRHAVRSSAGRVLSLPNVAYAGPQQAGRVATGDEQTGLQVRTVLLDTTAVPWRAAFLVGSELVGKCVFPASPAGISHVAISLFPDTAARFRLFSFKARPVPPVESE